jgi:hypothetical protein
MVGWHLKNSTVVHSLSVDLQDPRWSGAVWSVVEIFFGASRIDSAGQVFDLLGE